MSVDLVVSRVPGWPQLPGGRGPALSRPPSNHPASHQSRTTTGPWGRNDSQRSSLLTASQTGTITWLT